MNRLLLDTNVVSALRAPQREAPAFQRWLRHLDVDVCVVSSLTWMEIWAGVLEKRRSDAAQAEVLQAWFRVIHHEFEHRTVSFDDPVAITAGALWLLRPRGSIDTLIAGTALAHGLTLATRNVTDFADIPDLSLVNPWD